MKRFVHVCLRILGTLPLPLLHAIGAALGTLLWLVPGTPRRRALVHLALCFPELSERERRRLARASLRHMAMAVMESPAIWFGSRRRLQRWLDAPAAQAALRTAVGGRAAIILCPHLGSWELAGMFCAANGRITSLYKPQKGVMDALILEGRARLGAQLAPSTAGGVKALLQALKRGEWIGVLPDQDPPPGSGEFAPLFGRPAHTPTLVCRMAQRSQAPVWFCLAHRRSWGRGYAIELLPVSEDLADARDGLAALNRAIERVVRAHPEQYWWSYARFRRLPPGAPALY